MKTKKEPQFEVDTLRHLPVRVTKQQNIWTECFNWIQKKFPVIREVHVRYYTMRFDAKGKTWKFYLPYEDTKLQNVLLNEGTNEWCEIFSLQELKKKLK